MANLISMRPNDEFYLMGRTEAAGAKDVKAQAAAAPGRR
jgi:hypothetical protein